MPPDENNENQADTALLERGLRAAWEIVRDRRLRERLLQEDGDAHTSQFLAERQLPEAAKPHLFQILERVETMQHTAPTPAPEAAAATGPDKDIPAKDEVGSLLLESFIHIRWSFWTSMIMSVVLFVVGILLLVISVARALTEADVSTATLTIAGLSLADFVLLFYSRPWKDVATNLSNSQQVKIIATSYLSSLALLRNGRFEELKALDSITKNAVGLLEDFTEEQGRMRTETTNST
jgi:hypothetical protein